jgi:hypothetical protein
MNHVSGTGGQKFMGRASEFEFKTGDAHGSPGAMPEPAIEGGFIKLETVEIRVGMIE